MSELKEKKENKVIKVLKNQILWDSILVGLVGFVISFIYSITDFFRFDSSVVESVIAENGEILLYRLVATGIMCFIFSVIACIIGKKVKISKHETMDRKNVYIFFAVFLIVPLILCLLDKYFYASNIEDFVSVKFNLYNLFSSVLYNGLLEEIWFRYGIVSFITFLVLKIFDKKNKGDKKYYIIGAVFASLLIFSVEFYAILNIYRTINVFIVLRAVLNYLVMNIIYSYYFMRYDLKSSMFLHSMFLIFFVGVYPLVLALI